MDYPVRILINGMTQNPGGIESYIMNLYRNIDRERFQFDFVTNQNGEIAYKDEIKNMGGKIYPLTGRNENFFKHYFELFSFFRKHKEYKIIYDNSLSLVNIDFLVFGTLNNIKTRILHSHNNNSMNEKKNPIREWLAKFHKVYIQKFANHFFACSEMAGEWMFGDIPFVVIKNAIDPKMFKYDESIRHTIRKKLRLEDKLIIGSIGRLQYQKNPEFIVDIFKEFHTMFSNSVLLHVGDGDMREKVEQRIEKYDLQNNVLLMGVRNDIPDLLQAIDIFLLPSRFEGLGIVLVEAQVSGLKCYTTKYTVPNEVNVTGLITYTSLEESAEVWANKIFNGGLSYIRDDKSSEISEAGYDIALTARKMEDFFIDVLKNHY